MFKSKTAIEKEWFKLQRQELDFLVKNIKKEDSKLVQLLEDKVPEGLQATLDKAFYKSFQIIFEKGTDIIEKTYRKEKIEEEFEFNEFKEARDRNKKNLKAYSSNAKTSGVVNTLVSGVSGVGLGALGIGIPDIFLFTGTLLKNVYQIALNFGYDYDKPDEKKFILLLIQGALSSGNDLRKLNDEADYFIANGEFTSEANMEERIRDASDCLSKELLYMKFLQGIPVVGALGGAYNALYMQKVSKYAELKYRRRLYTKRREEMKK